MKCSMFRTALACAVAALGVSMVTSGVAYAGCTGLSTTSGTCSLDQTNTTNFPVNSPYGTVSWSENSTDTTLTITVTLDPGLVAKNDTNAAFGFQILTSGTANLSLGTGTSTNWANLSTSPPSVDGFGKFSAIVGCSATMDAACGNTFTIVVNATGGGTITGIGLNGTNFAFGLHVNDTLSSPNCSAFVGAGTGTATQDSSCSFAVPGPIAGAGLPGILAACIGLFALARRRRQQVVA